LYNLKRIWFSGSKDRGEGRKRVGRQSHAHRQCERVSELSLRKDPGIVTKMKLRKSKNTKYSFSSG